MRSTVIVALLFAALSFPAAAAANSETATVRHAISWQRARTWHWQDVAHVRRSPEIPGAASSTHSPGYLRWIEHRWNARRLVAYKFAHRPRPSPTATGSVPEMICSVWGSATCGEAKAIAWTESKYETWAANGQYLGIFQMGTTERATYAKIGYSTAYQQIVAAHTMYEARGFEPWTCCEG